MSSFTSDNNEYEAWLGTRCCVVKADLDEKHRRMRKTPFVFLRATYFRWAKVIASVCPTLKKAPAVLSVGDLHLENFGTWRDADGRLVWGVNDFDEAAVIPYPFDLVRLATSALLLPDIEIDRRDLRALLDGYRRGLEKPRATLVDERERWMRPLVAASDHVRNAFWSDIDKIARSHPPSDAKDALKRSLPEDCRKVRFGSWAKGGGSLGRPRFVAIANWQGGRIVREAKALIPSAWDWAHPPNDLAPHFKVLSHGRFRAPDPFLRARDNWIVRRIAADSRKIDIGDDLDPQLLPVLLGAMGFDLGAVHAADPQSRKIEADLRDRESDWLQEAAKAAKAAVKKDYREWRRKTAPKP